MLALSSLSDASVLGISGFEVALQQPLFPGKLILWALFMLSLLTWAIMISKALFLRRMKRADEAFVKKFRGSRQPLQLFERNFTDPLSIRSLVYDHGARETAFQMLGSPERDETFSTRLEQASVLRPEQMSAIRDAFSRGEAAAAARIRQGISILNAASAGAPFLGLLGMVWILMQTFSANTGVSADSPLVSAGIAGGLAVMAVALLVTTPAVFGHILIAASGRERLRQLGDFRTEVVRLIEICYLHPVRVTTETPGTAERPPPRPESEPTPGDEDFQVEETIAPDPAPAAVIEPEPEPKPEPELAMEESDLFCEFEAAEPQSIPPEPELEPEAYPVPAEPERRHRRSYFETPFSEPEINPIAQQTANLKSEREPATA